MMKTQRGKRPSIRPEKVRQAFQPDLFGFMSGWKA